MARNTPTAPVEPLPVLPPGSELVTDAQLAAAELAAQQAAAKLDAKERSDTSGQELGGLALAARRAGLEFARLRDAHAAQERLLQHRGAAEQAARPVVAEMAERLEVSRRAVTAAIVDAEKALQRLVETAQAHDVAVRGASAELAGRGLLAADVFGDHESGGSLDGQGVRLGGKWWSSPGASGLFCRSVAVVAEWAWGAGHPAAGLRRDFRVISAVQRGAAILAGVPALPPRPPSSKAG